MLSNVDGVALVFSGGFVLLIILIYAFLFIFLCFLKPKAWFDKINVKARTVMTVHSQNVQRAFYNGD